jgi:hypothetical protein
LIRYKIGDMVRIQSLRDDKLGINLPQMTFERRSDDFLDFYVVNFTEKSIWKAIESIGVPYEDWIAYKDAEHLTLNIGIELKEDQYDDKERLAALIYDKLTQPDSNKSTEVTRENDLTDIADFGIKIDLLPKGTFADFLVKRQAEGADLAHLKPPHVNPPDSVISTLLADVEETIVVTKSGTKVSKKSSIEKVGIS